MHLYRSTRLEPFLGTILLEVSVGRDFGALKGLAALRGIVFLARRNCLRALVAIAGCFGSLVLVVGGGVLFMFLFALSGERVMKVNLARIRTSCTFLGDRLLGIRVKYF